MNFTFSVYETVIILKEYKVSADTFEEACQKAEHGETVYEEEIRVENVLNRTILNGA